MGQGESKKDSHLPKGGPKKPLSPMPTLDLPAETMQATVNPWNYLCNECGQDTTPVRYACSECLHYDLCQACFDAKKHVEHMDHVLYHEHLHPQQIFDQLCKSPSSGQALLKMFKYYGHRLAFAYREPIKVERELNKSIEEQIAQETSEASVSVKFRGSHRTPLNPYKWVTFTELGQRVHDVGAGLRQLVEPRSFVGICSHVQLPWYIADYACQIHSIIGPVIAPTSSLEAIVHIINSTKMSLVFSTEALVPRFLAASATCPSLKYVIQLEDLEEYEVRPKVKAASDGLRKSAARNLLRQSQKSAVSSSSGSASATSSSALPVSSSTSVGAASATSSEQTGQPTQAAPSSSQPSDSSNLGTPSSSSSSQPPVEAASPQVQPADRANTQLPKLLTPEDVAEWKTKLTKTEGIVVLSLSDLERLGQNVDEPEPFITPPNELETLVYTSGSTGIPKGAMYTCAAWKEQLCFEYAHTDITKTMSWSISDRKNDYRHLYFGGCVCIYNGDMSRIFEDIGDIRPHAMNATPAFWNKIYAEFKAELAEATKDLDMTLAANAQAAKDIRQSLLKDFSGLLGGRVDKIVTGGAPSSPEVLAFMRECFQCRVRESYGTTEVGGVVSEGLFVPGLKWKLISWEEYTTDDKPCARGELCVKRDDMMAGYYGEKELTAEALDEDGYYHTGDIVELNMYQNGAHVIDRKKNIFKLSQGEYVAPAKIEKLLVGKSPFIHQVFVYGDSLKSSLVAVIVPHKDALMEYFLNLPESQANIKNKVLGNAFDKVCALPEAIQVLLSECARIGKAHNLRTFEIPAAVVLTTTEFTKENGLGTPGDKPLRHALLKYFKKEIEALYTELDTKHSETKAAVYKLFGKGMSNGTTAQVVIDPDAKDDDAQPSNLSFVQMGGDSLTAIKLRNMIKKNFDVSLPVDVLLNPNTDLAKIATYIDDSKRSTGKISADQFAAPSVDIRTLMRDARLNPEWKPPKGKVSWSLSKLKHVFLTGASGFLGTAILADLLKETSATIFCLVRPRAKSTRASGRDSEKQAASLLQVLEKRVMDSGLLGDNPLKYMKKSFAQRVAVLEGSLEAPHFGLSDGDWQGLQAVQAIFHAGAYVNSVLPYHRLAPSNVEGTRTCLELCSAGHPKLLVHVSTSSVLAAKKDRYEAPLEGELWTISNDLVRLGGYNLSKYIAELLVWDAVDRGFPCIVVRPGFIGSAAATGYSNDNDFDNRLVIGLTQLKSAPDSVSPLITFPVDFMSKLILSLTEHESSNGQVYHLVNNASEFSLKLIVDGLITSGYEIATTTYEEWQKNIQAMTDEQNPIFTMVDEYFSRPYFHYRQPANSTDRTTAFIKIHMKSKIPATDAEYVGKMISWLQQHHFIEAPTKPVATPSTPTDRKSKKK